MRRLALRPHVFRTVVLLIVLNAAAGIIVIVAGSGQVGSTEAHVFETTGLLSLAALLLLPCAVAYESGRPPALPSLPWLAAGCIVPGFGLAVYLVWEDPAGDTTWQLAASLCVAGAALAHVCLLWLARPKPSFVWLQVLACFLTLLLAAVIIGAFWTEPEDGGFDDWQVRAFAVLAILTAAGSLLVPIVDRLSTGTQQVSPRPRFCPNCGAALANGDACAACGSRFRVEFYGPEQVSIDAGPIKSNVEVAP